jgi:hypothetical protein
MSLLLCLLAITLIGVAGWGFQSVMAELAKSYPQEPVDTFSRRFQVDEFIWSPRAPLALRRQYILRHRLAPSRRASAWPRWCGSTSRVPMSVSWGLLPSVPCHFWGPLLWLGRPCGEGADTFRETAALFLAPNSTRRGGLTMFVERGRPEGAGQRQSDAIAPKLASALDAAAPANGCDADQ